MNPDQETFSVSQGRCSPRAVSRHVASLAQADPVQLTIRFVCRRLSLDAFDTDWPGPRAYEERDRAAVWCRASKFAARSGSEGRRGFAARQFGPLSRHLKTDVFGSHLLLLRIGRARRGLGRYL